LIDTVAWLFECQLSKYQITTGTEKLCFFITLTRVFLFFNYKKMNNKVVNNMQNSTIFSFDGHDFIRTHTTLLTEDKKSADNTKLDQDNPGYKALIKKQSYSGEVSLFGEKYNANFAPLTDKDGNLTGALMVCMPA
jgi:hypothetical protein